jgi:hypothetical protein
MKPTTKAALLGALAASTVFAAVPALLPKDAIAQEPAKIVVAPAGPEEYRFLSLAPYQNDTGTRRMEEALNKLAAEGWKVRAGVGISLVLVR